MTLDRTCLVLALGLAVVWPAAAQEAADHMPPLVPWDGPSRRLVLPADHPWTTPAESSGLTRTPSYDETTAWLRRLVEAADDGIDLVIGSRFAGGYATAGHRRLAMRTLASWMSHRVGVELDDVTSGFRVISQPLLGFFAEHYPAEYLGDTVEAILQADAFGATIAQVPVPMAQRETGDATSSITAGGHLARMAVAIVAGKPQRVGR